MKLVEMKCKNCGSILKASPEDKEVTCKYCQTTFKIDDEIIHHKFDNAEQMGYEMEKGRLRAQKEAKDAAEAERYAQQQTIYQNEKKKKNRVWWILGWIFCFPIPLTVLIWKNQKWTKNTKIILTILLWGVFVIIGNSQDTETDTVPIDTNTPIQENDNTQTDYADKFIELFNKRSIHHITNIEKFDAQNKNSGHYRTEFRLNAWKNNISYNGKIDKYTIDVIQYGNNYENIRIYFNFDNIDIRNDVLKYILSILDSTISEEEINKITNSTERENITLGITNQITGYADSSELMINSSSLDF